MEASQVETSALLCGVREGHMANVFESYLSHLVSRGCSTNSVVINLFGKSSSSSNIKTTQAEVSVSSTLGGYPEPPWPPTLLVELFIEDLHLPVSLYED